MATTIQERRARLEARFPSWEPRTIAQHLEWVAAAHPDRPLVLTEQRSFTYAEMAAWSRRLARGLIAEGIRPGEHVAIVMANHPEIIALRFAIAAVGAVAVPLNYLFRTEELGYVLDQSDCVLLVTMEQFGDLDYLEMLDALAPGWESKGGGTDFPKLRSIVTFGEGARPGTTDLGDMERRGDASDEGELDKRLAAGSADDLVDIVYTSGTTGFPKGVMLTHDNLLRCAYSAALIRAMSDGQRTLFALPLYHNFGNVEGLLAATFVAGAVIPHVTFDPEQTFRDIERFDVQESVFVPTMTVALLEHPARTSYDLSSLRTVMSAGAPAPVRLWEQVRGELGVSEILTAYGQTETAASSSYVWPEDSLELVATTVGRQKPGGTAGAPELDGLVVKYKTIDPVDGSDLPEGANGELVAKGPQVMRGYYNKPEESAAVLDDAGWMRSGDLGYIGADGYIRLTGRSKELYKSGGELVAPKEVEELLSQLPEVSQAYVVGVPDNRWGEAGCAFVVPAPGMAIDEADVIAFCKANLARFKVPKHVLQIDAEQLPMTPTGKIRKFQLVERAQAELRRPTGQESPHMAIGQDHP